MKRIVYRINWLLSEYLVEQPGETELFVVDDGSTDDTCAAVRDFFFQSAIYKVQMRLIENDHRGKGYIVRAGMFAALGQYIFFY
jgi:glycosyltransferase involved in cell wall biosynthesis